MLRAPAVKGIGQRFVYILHSESDPSRHYVGRTADVDERLHWHNEGPSGYTGNHRPWLPIVVLEFPNGSAAARFERYLKSGSGRAFAKRHFGVTTDPSPSVPAPPVHQNRDE
jgi:putative endonuclease